MRYKLKPMFEWGGGTIRCDDDTSLDRDHPPGPKPWTEGGRRGRVLVFLPGSS
ncbi:MAG: hypothetical protein PVJ04_03220 [Gemmatimonadota bacterium]